MILITDVGADHGHAYLVDPVIDGQGFTGLRE